MYDTTRTGSSAVLTPPPPPHAQPPLPVGRRRSTSVWTWVALAMSVLALILSIAALVRTMPEKEQEEVLPEPEVVEPEPEYIVYRDKEIPIAESVARSRLIPSGLDTDENGWLTYEYGDTVGVTGIDVSSHQGDIDWKKVAKSGVEFAMVRVGYRGYGEEGKLMLDANYQQNIEGAQAAGLDVGVYFFSQATSIWEVEEELEMLLGAIEGYELTCPVVFDWEHITTSSNSRTRDISGASISRMADFFCHEVTQAGFTPAVYFNKDLAYLYLDLERLDGNTFWLAEYDSVPDFYYHFEMWQYTSKGRVPGIEGNVDMNLAFQTASEGAEEG